MVRIVFVAASFAACAVAQSSVQQPVFAFGAQVQSTWVIDDDGAVGDLNGDGVPDLVNANPGIALGSNNVAFRAELLDDSGEPLRGVFGPPPVPPTALACTVRVAVGDFDEDGHDDVVSLGAGLALGLMRNGGQGLSVNGFQTAELIDDLNLHFEFYWPTLMRVPVFQVDDFDHDGHLDVLIAPQLVDFATREMSSPGLLCYFGNGDGSFAPLIRHPLATAPVDADWVDRNGDGVGDSLVVLGQTSGLGLPNTSDITWFAFFGRGIAVTTPSQSLSLPEYTTSVAWVPSQNGNQSGHLVVTGHGFPSAETMDAQLRVVAVDAQQRLGTAYMVPLPVDVNASPKTDLQAATSADFNGDGYVDVVVTVARTGMSALLLVMNGPFNSFGAQGGTSTFDLDLSGRELNRPSVAGSAQLPSWTPNISAPDGIHVVDFDLDHRPDLVVSGLCTLNGSLRFGYVTLLNRTEGSGETGFGYVRRASQGRSTPADLSPRIGIAGGLPVLDNSEFRLTLTDVPKDALATLIAGTASMGYQWGPLPLAAIPDHFSPLYVVHSAAEGLARIEHPMPVPDDPRLIGVEAGFCWLICDLNSPDPEPFYNSESLHVRFGAR